MAIKILDTIEPAGKFKVVKAEDVAYSENSVASALTNLQTGVDSLQTDVDDLQTNVDEITRILTGIPTFDITGIPTGVAVPNEEIKVNILVESENAAECRILVRRQKEGSSQIQTSSATCYPGQEYPITLGTLKELGVFNYTISVTNGTKRCGLKGTTGGDEADIQYEKTFSIVCGTATLLLPVFEYTTKNNIYSFDLLNKLSLDFNYTIAQAFKSYIFKIELLKNNVIIDTYTKSQTFELSTEANPGTTVKQTIDYDLKVSNSDTSAAYALKISAEAFDSSGQLISTSKVESEFVIDFMVNNSIMHSLVPLNDNLTSNDYLNIQFVPKTNNTNFNSSVIKYSCELYRYNNNEENTLIKAISVNAYNLQTSTVSFDKFITLDTMLAGLAEGATQKYQLKLQCTDLAIANRQLTDLEFSITKVPDLSSDYVKDGLELYFDFSQNLESKASVIENSCLDNTGYSLNLINTNVESAREFGEIITSDKRLTGTTPAEEYATYFTFRSGQGAVLVDNKNQPVDPQKTFYTDTILHPEFIPGYSFELLFKSTFLGDYSSVAASFGNNSTDIDATDGISLPVGKCRTYNKGESVEASVRHGVWKHVVFVVERNPEQSIRYKIYINGILSAIKAFNDEDSVSDSTPLTLNGIFAKVTQQAGVSLQKSGTTSIKFVRYYSMALNDEEVFQNFKTIYTKKEYKDVINKRNDRASSVNVFFIKNDPIIRNRPENKVSGYISFEDLNKITKKKPESSNDTSYTSKTHAVNGTMLYSYVNELGELIITKYPNVDIFLQGTSSLKYPVKNYQIKVYSDKTEEQYGQVANGKDSKKLSVYPPATDDTNWTTPSYIYTLKCDYMEESHRNNTPTACYYQDNVLDSVIAYCESSEYYKNLASIDNSTNDVLYPGQTGVYSSYSPARRHVEVSNDTTISPYRDAIDGRPCIVYYSDIPLTREISTENDLNDLINVSTCAGSFMFNVDKEGPQLGFELPATDINTSAYPAYSDYLVDNKVKVDGSGKIAIDGQITLTNLPCISYEGATNDNFSAAAFMPYTVQRAQYLKYAWENAPETSLIVDGTTKVYKYFNLRKVTSDNFGTLVYSLNNEGLTESDTAWKICFEKESGFGNELTDLDVLTASAVTNNGEPVIPTEAVFEGQFCYYTGNSLENCKAWKYTNAKWEEITDILTQYDNSDQQRISQVSFLSFIVSYYHDRLPSKLDGELTRAIHGCNTVTEHKDIYGKNEYDYIKKTLEPRFTFVDDIDDATLKAVGYSADDLTFSTMKDAIDWAYSCFVMLDGDETTKIEGKAKFRSEFNRYFSFEYCLTYFLQMMLFTQVDNAGKNAMFDTWGNGKLYPRPYDMDTQMGLNNSGTDRIPVSAELNPIFSPQLHNRVVTNSTWATSSDSSHIRFLSYNTTNSALWKTFALSFAEEIKACYSYLRKNRIYDVDTIQDYINSKTRDVIGETYYNKDAHNKYLYNAEDTSYYYCVNGSREDRYYEFLSNRITFLDSYYEYSAQQTTGEQNNTIMLRALPLEIGDYLILKPLSPMYVSVTAEPATTTCLITPDDTYLDDNGDTQIGSKFTFQMEAPDKNMYITGSNNLSDIAGLETLTISEIKLNNAKNMTALAVTNAPELQNLTIAGSSNLKTLDLSNNPKLKVQLDLHECSNLKSVNISNSGITSLTLPENCDLTYLNCTDCKGLKSLSIKNMPNLTTENLILTGCEKLATLEIENCPKIVSTDENPFIKDVAGEADRDKILPALQQLTVKNCPNFAQLTLLQRNLSKLCFDFEEGGLSKLNLASCYGKAFSSLDLYNCPALKTVDLSDVKSNDLPDDINQVRLRADHEYDNVDMSYSQINVVYTNTCIENKMNLDNVIFNKFIIKYNKHVSDITGLNYTGDLKSMFYECTALKTLTDVKLTAAPGTTVNSMFYACSTLEGISGELDFTEATSAISTCNNCKKLTQTSLETIIKAFGEQNSKVGNMDSFAYDCDNCEELIVSLPASITSLKSAFYHMGKLRNVDSNLLQNCSKLKDVTGLFKECTNLEFVHKDIFKKCTGLQSVRACFTGCTNLGAVPDDNNILYSSLDIFPEVNQITDISFMFYACSNLTNKQGIGDGYGRQAETSIDDDIYANKFFTKLTGLKHAICTFYGATALKLYFKDSIFNFSEEQSYLTHIDGLFAKSGLCNIPSKLSNNCLPSLKNARGVFSNIVPVGDNNDESGENSFTRITSSFFENTTAIEHISDSLSVAGDPTFQPSGYKPAYGGIFANVPNLLLETGCFSTLTNLKSANRAIFMGSIADSDAGKYNKYNTRSTIHPNIHPGEDYVNDDTIIKSKYYPKVVACGTNDEIRCEVDLFAHNTKTLEDVAYLFAGNPTIQSVSNEFIDSLSNAVDLSGIFSNCMELTCDTSDGNNLLSFTANKAKLTSAKFAFENCYKLIKQITDGGTTILTGTATASSSLTCLGMFYGSGITGKVPANLFEDCRGKITNTSYMFAKCYNLTGIETGYAKDYNIPYVYDDSEVEYYYMQNKEALAKYVNYADFKNNITEHFTENCDNWFGEGKKFDRYRNYLAQWFYKQSRYYPDGLTQEDLTKIIVQSTVPGDASTSGRYYVTNEDNEGLWVKSEDGQISQETSHADPKRIYLETEDENGDKQLISITSISESGEAATIEDLAKGNYRPVSTQDAQLLSRNGYYLANNKYTIVQKGLLSDCTKLSNVIYMFAGCYGLTGCIPADLFAYTKNYLGLTSIEGLFAGCTNLTLNATPKFDEEKIGMIESCSDSLDYNTTVYDSLDENSLKGLSGGGFYSKIYPTVIYLEDDDRYRSVVIDDDETEDAENYFIPKDWLSKLTLLTNIKNAFNSVGIAADLRTDSIGRIITPTYEVVGRPSSDTSEFSDDSFIYSYLKLDNLTFDKHASIATANGAFKNVYTLGATKLGKDFLSKAKYKLQDISYIFATATLRQVTKPFQEASNLTNVKDCFYALNTNYNIHNIGADGPRATMLFKDQDDTPTSWMNKNPGGYILNSEAPELWKHKKISAQDKNNSLASLTPVTEQKSWFNYRTNDSGYSTPFNPNSIKSPDDLRQ